MLSTDTRIPRWMRLAMPDDVAQIAAMVDFMYATVHQRSVALKHELRELRRVQWDRLPSKPTPRPSGLRPSKRKRASGYLTDPQAKQSARAKVSPERRAEIAQMGASARQARRKQAA